MRNNPVKNALEGGGRAIGAMVLLTIWLVPKLFRLIAHFLDRLAGIAGIAERRDREVV